MPRGSSETPANRRRVRLPKPRTASDGFAKDDEEAESLYGIWKSEDPFPNILPALLNSGDIADYVAATGMIHPFNPIADKLKPASYEVDLLGRCVSFTGPRREDIEISDIDREAKFVLRKNEIAFVQMEPHFRLPQYMALRFNLRIKHVYRGLLLGTGPLVDPGFEGHLWIPLHNLTENDYTFTGGEGLVWMEFTKLSPILPKQQRTKHQKYFSHFPDEKLRRQEIEDYLHYADPYRPIRSSIPGLVVQARDESASAAASSSAASKAAEKAERQAKNVALVGAVGVLIAVVAVVLTSWAIVTSVRDRAEDAFRKAERVELQLQRFVGPTPSPQASPAPPQEPSAPPAK